ncbi:winged helix-turn-helix domain-containing protein [Agrobacterium tumefaciens]|uniref:winged helix-turn-helix domain-containing protein n=1 Tax=Agrobacterium tumefaciens TaxID=358 RepID=UPI00045A5440|nr:winged helix-turn-helix domain-containing protein [Agrobacterium tumefaciens]CDN91781.1 hypothetical protein BN949_00918 [Agrobacterium tumefaciens]
MTASASTLDIEKFRKVHVLITKGATDGERASAKGRCEAMAKKAGLSLKQAVSKLDASAAPKPAGFFDDFADWMEEREPGFKAKRSKEEAEREARYAKRRAEILREFGTLKAFFDPTTEEQLILDAAKPFITAVEKYEDVCGTIREQITGYGGSRGSFVTAGKVSAAALDAVKNAYPFPTSILDAFAELKRWDKLERDRACFYDHHEFYFDTPVELRIDQLRGVMRSMPVTSWADLEARFWYKSYAWQQQWLDEKDFEDDEWARLFADFQILRASAKNGHPPQEPDTAHPAQNGRRTNADKAADVKSLLQSNPELSDREISRRVGVSPQTVGNWRTRLAQTEMFQPEQGSLK